MFLCGWLGGGKRDPFKQTTTDAHYFSTSRDLFEARRLSKEAGQEGFATRSPDGKSIAFNSTRDQNRDICLMDLDPDRIHLMIQ